MKKFKVLFLYPNGKLMNPPPVSIGIFTALLRQNGFEAALFDSTLYPNFFEKGSDESKQENLQVRPFDYGQRGVKLKETDPRDDLVKKIETVKPDLIAISLLECTYKAGLGMLKAIENYNIPIIAGGVFATFAPELVLANKNVDMVCIGEGEDTLLEVCKNMARGKDCLNIDNLYLKHKEEIVKNKLRKPVNLDSLPIPDYSLFEDERFFRPMAGRVYKAIPIETNRGCPFGCTFCNSPSFSELYLRQNKGVFFRKKSMKKIGEELNFLVKQWGAEYVYFSSDTFLTLKDNEFEEFIRIYEKIKLPFWIQSRVEAVSEYRIKKLKEAGCHRMSIGLEHGNVEFRKKVLGKNFDNRKMIEASKIIAGAGIPLTVNNIIGFPGETRELIFDTINLNRKLTFDTTNAVAFAPFHGTALHQLCLDKGYIDGTFNPGALNVDIPLDMPQLPREQIKGLKRTFALYARMPEKYWQQIEKAEKFDKEGNRIFTKLSEIYKKNYFGRQKIES